MDAVRDRIVQLIKDLGYNLSGFAKELGVAQPVISHLSSGRNLPSLDLVMKILKRFPQISPDWLLFGTGNRERALTENVQKELEALEEQIELTKKYFNTLKKKISKQG